MPIAASSLERESYLFALLMGRAKLGKTTCAVTSLAKAFGLGYVIVCGKAGSLKPAQRRTSKFEYDIVRDENDMDTAIKEARKGVKDGRFKWVVLDDFTMYAAWLENELANATRNAKGEADGRRFWPEYHSRLKNIVSRLADCKAHFIAICHYIEQGKEIEGQLAKTGDGIAPSFGGKSREEIPAMFQDVVWMDKDSKGDRIFKINPEGVFGPACRSFDDARDIAADFGVFMREMDKIEDSKSKTNGKDSRSSTSSR